MPLKTNTNNSFELYFGSTCRSVCVCDLTEKKKIASDYEEGASNSDMSDGPESVCCQKINFVQETLRDKFKAHWTTIKYVSLSPLICSDTGSK